MADILDLQRQYDETPDDEKGSFISVIACTRSYHSIFLCYAK